MAASPDLGLSIDCSRAIGPNERTSPRGRSTSSLSSRRAASRSTRQPSGRTVSPTPNDGPSCRPMQTFRAKARRHRRQPTSTETPEPASRAHTRHPIPTLERTRTRSGHHTTTARAARTTGRVAEGPSSIDRRRSGLETPLDDDRGHQLSPVSLPPCNRRPTDSRTALSSLTKDAPLTRWIDGSSAAVTVPRPVPLPALLPVAQRSTARPLRPGHRTVAAHGTDTAEAPARAVPSTAVEPGSVGSTFGFRLKRNICHRMSRPVDRISHGS